MMFMEPYGILRVNLVGKVQLLGALPIFQALNRFVVGPFNFCFTREKNILGTPGSTQTYSWLCG